MRLTDLVKKLEKSARIMPEDAAIALFHERTEVRKRLDGLESQAALKTEAGARH